MSGVKHTPVSGVHPDNTALRAVDACGGTYTSAEEASGWAGGHRAALASAMVAVGHADGVTAALLEAGDGLLAAYRSAVRVYGDEALGLIADHPASWASIMEAAIARARGEQDGGGE